MRVISSTNKTLDYGKSIEYIDSFINFEKIPQYSYASSFNLERMRAFLNELGNPHHSLKSIHIAGSKGKGSACAVTASILREAGYSAGLYTSPHLLDVRERIRILGAGKLEGAVGEGEFVELVEKIKPAAEKFRDHKELGRLSFFEFLTAAAFLYFREKGADFAVLETGLGGRLDATNVTEPLVSGITNISMEHSDKLGGSLESIAREKAGIIKPRGKAVSSPQEKEAMDVIIEACREKKTALYKIGTDTIYTVTDLNENGQTFNLDGPGYSYDNLRLNLLGRHQAENAALAITMVKIVDHNISEDSIRNALAGVSWPGRLQIVRKRPYVVLDGAQNALSVEKALSSVREIFDYGKLICVFGVMSDKDIKGMAGELDRACDIIILTKPDSLRAKAPLELKKFFHSAAAEIKDDTGTALKHALTLADKEDLVLVTGSLYLVSEAMKWLT